MPMNEGVMVWRARDPSHARGEEASRENGVNRHIALSAFHRKESRGGCQWVSSQSKIKRRANLTRL